MVILNQSDSNLNFNLLRNNEFDSTLTDEMIDVALEQRSSNLDNDNRPQISSEFNRNTNNLLHRDEEEKVIKKVCNKVYLGDITTD